MKWSEKDGNRYSIFAKGNHQQEKIIKKVKKTAHNGTAFKNIVYLCRVILIKG